MVPGRGLVVGMVSGGEKGRSGEKVEAVESRATLGVGIGEVPPKGRADP